MKQEKGRQHGLIPLFSMIQLQSCLSTKWKDIYTWFWLPLKQGQALFSGARDKIQGNRHKQKQRRLLQNIWKHFFTLSVTKHRNRLPREAVVSPSLEMLKTHLEMILSSWLGWPCLSRGLNRLTTRAPFHSQLLCDSVIIVLVPLHLYMISSKTE